MRKIYILILLLIGYVGAEGQDTQPTDIPKVVPPSPNAASLGKFGDIPVGLYTGIPNVNIPLWEAKCGKFSLPIGLSYHSQGMKVEEKSGWVGLNWTLNAGGAITRSVRGGADETGYWTFGSWTNEYIAADYMRTRRVCSGEYDMQPDMFYFNFAGYSGKFVLSGDASHTAYTIPFQNLKIIPGPTLGSFEIVDPNGIRYLFNDVEMTTDDNIPPTLLYYKSAWYLSKIITPAGEITFSYGTDKSYYEQFSETDHAVTNPSDQNAQFFKPTYQGRFNYIEVDTRVISEITTPTEKIKFTSSLDRSDMPTASRLQSFTVQDNSGIIKKKFTFNQSYFGNINSSLAENKRLKLDGVIESSADGTMTKSYLLDYYDPTLVPSVKSLSQDYWGYYNGKTNSSMLTYLDPALYGTYIANQAAAFKGDRSPVFENARVSALKKITYPTGGTSEFIYEANDYGYIRGVPVNEEEIATLRAMAQAKISTTVNIPSNTATFSISANQSVVITFQGSYTNPPPVENGPTITINKIESNGSRTKIVQRFMINTTETVTQHLMAGNYEVIASVDGSGQTSTAYIDYKNPTGVVFITKQTGGVRIKQIINSDLVSNIQNIKTYEYVTKDNPNRSSGVIAAEPLFIEDKGPYKMRSSSSANYLGFTQGSHVGYSMVTEKYTGPTSVGKKESYFTSAKEYNNAVGTNYRVTEVNNVVLQTVYSSKYVTDYDVCRGYLQKEHIYNAQDQLVKEIITEYNLPAAIKLDSFPRNYFEIKSKAGTYYRNCILYCAQCYCEAGTTNCQTCNEYILDKFYLTDTKVICPWIYKVRTKETTYDPVGLNPFTVQTDYFYDNPSHGLVTRMNISNSKGETIGTISKYPQDKSQISGLSTNASTALDAMVAANKTGPAIEIEKYNGSSLVSRIRTDYKIWNAAAKIIEPEIINVQNTNGPLEGRVQFFNYDDKANVLEQGKVNDAKEVYLWGYNKLYPVAKVVGADYSTVVALVDQNVLLNPSSDQQLRDELNKIRTGLAATALVTTYTYLPLIGMSSSTDPSGKTTYYEYDALGRLKLEKDQNGKILKQYDYQYQKPVTQ